MTLYLIFSRFLHLEINLPFAKLFYTFFRLHNFMNEGYKNEPEKIS